MTEKSFSYGCGCAFMGGSYPSPSRRETAIRAKIEGFGFIQQNSVRWNRTHTIILAWDIKVLSYQEALECYKDNTDIVSVIESHRKAHGSQVFLIAPLPEELGSVDIFPFDMVDELRVVRFEDLLSPKFHS